MLISEMWGHVAFSLPMSSIMKSRSCAMSVLSVRLIPIPSLWYVAILGCWCWGMLGLGSISCHLARETIEYVELISCHQGS